ncbi:MAG: hypothetical protein O7J95_20450 [Planctomycetota bacterium]|nr:hypothetical protein [Planctomycetota bacterium]
MAAAPAARLHRSKGAGAPIARGRGFQDPNDSRRTMKTPLGTLRTLGLWLLGLGLWLPPAAGEAQDFWAPATPAGEKAAKRSPRAAKRSSRGSSTRGRSSRTGSRKRSSAARSAPSSGARGQTARGKTGSRRGGSSREKSRWDDLEDIDLEDIDLEDIDLALAVQDDPTARRQPPAPGRSSPAPAAPGAGDEGDGAGAEPGSEPDGGLGAPPAAEDGGEGAPAGAAPPGAGVADASGAVGVAEAEAVDDAGDDGRQFLPRSSAFRTTVDILDGQIPVKEFLRFLADYTGWPVIIEASPQQAGGITQEITIAAPIEDADAEMVKAILEANRWLITKGSLPPDDKPVLYVKNLASPATGQHAPTVTPIIQVGKKGVEIVPSPIRAQDGVRFREDEIVTMLFTLQHIAPSMALQTLSEVITSAAPGRGQGAVRGNPAFTATEIQDTQMLIVTAKFSLLDYIGQILSIIDNPLEEPERIVHIIEVEEADASELVGQIESFLQQKAEGGRTGLSSRRGTTRTPSTTTARTTSPAARSRTSLRGRGGPIRPEDYPTQLLADPRTQKIIVQTYNAQDLEDINMLVRELDTKFDVRRLKTQIYRMKYLKAIDVAPVIQEVLGIGGGGRRSGASGIGRGGSRGTRGGQAGTPPGTTTPSRTRGIAGGTGQTGLTSALIVPHEETNSLIVLAEEEEFQEILSILEKIDVKRRQVFLEVALVQVSTSSALNFTIELLAGEPDDRSFRLLFESSFGLTGIDATNFNRIFPDLSTAPSGALLAFMNRGKFPALISALKANTDTEVLATPFILADDNVENEINITETRYVINVNTVNQVSTTSQSGEDAGITLNILPTISSANSVLLDIRLEVSEFAQTQTVDVLPPKTTNSLTSAVTISDDRIYVVGGLTRQNRSKTVSKVPILGDIPFLGKLFRSESAAKNLTNLYIFLRAHILVDDDFGDLGELTDLAQQQVARFSGGQLKISTFDTLQARDETPVAEDLDAPRQFELRRRQQYRHDPEGLRSTGRPGEGLPRTQRAPESPERSSPRPPAAAGDAGGERQTPRAPRPWETRGLEVDPEGDSWFLPLKKRTAHVPGRRSRRSPAVATGLITVGDSSR